MESIYNVHFKLGTDAIPRDKYIIAYGSEVNGDVCSKSELIKGYRGVLRNCRNQDATIYYNGKPIRTIRNFNQPILNPRMISGSVQRCEYVKYSC